MHKLPTENREHPNLSLQQSAPIVFSPSFHWKLKKSLTSSMFLTHAGDTPPALLECSGIFWVVLQCSPVSFHTSFKSLLKQHPFNESYPDPLPHLKFNAQSTATLGPLPPLMLRFFKIASITIGHTVQ